MSLLIDNFSHPCHYEIIESIIVKYNTIITGCKPVSKIHISIYKNKSFEKYITEKHQNVSFGKIFNPDYTIYSTIYDKDYNIIEQNSSNKFYISHRISDKLKKLNNVFFLSELASTQNIFNATILPYMDNVKPKTEFPIFVIQGSLKRRNINALEILLSRNFSKNFKIKILCKEVNLPSNLLKYKNKIILKSNLDYENFHKQFLDVYCLLTLISKTTHPQYYSQTLTSSVNYIRSYNLKCIVDEDLQNIYSFENAETYNNNDQFISKFEKVLNQFYI